MVQKGKLIVKERFNNGEIDLSMSDLDEVPVKEIAALKKTTSLDLSNNRLSVLPPNFTILTNLTTLDLSKNELTELPEDFGSLSKLKHLDLYKNKLERLPLTFGKLTALRFLDLKDNPLIPAIAKVAGPCVDTKGCQQCARIVVAFYSRLQEEVDNDLEMRKKARQKQLELNQQKKQEEKKKQKKEKQSNKAKKEVEKNNNKKSTNVVKKQLKKEQKKQKEKSGFLEQLFFFVLLSISVITGSWYLYNYQYDTVKPLLELFKYYYQIFLDKLPDSGRYYLKSVVESLSFVQQSTRNVTRKYIEVIKDNEMVQGFIFKVKDGISNIVGKFVGDKV